MLWKEILAPFTLVLLAFALEDPPAGGEDADHARAQELFVANCASCHGETGDGDGWTELDRPARSFRDGGFSFGNTPEALFRTISAGIPGTPMPGFDSSLSEADRKLLAAYVRTLGPPIEEIDLGAAVITIAERPRVIRGHLPPIATGAAEHPRGLLIGTVGGLTFEYRVDDVRLLGVRMGDFVRRRDWVGRGGTPLEPLGGVLHLMEGGNPTPTFALTGAEPTLLAARLRGTWETESDAGLRYTLVDADGTPHAEIEERPSGDATSRGSLFARDLKIRRLSSTELVARVPLPEEATLIEQLAQPHPNGGDPTQWIVHRTPVGSFVCTGVTAPAGVRLHVSGDRVDVQLGSDATGPSTFALRTVLTTTWNDEMRASLGVGGPR